MYIFEHHSALEKEIEKEKKRKEDRHEHTCNTTTYGTYMYVHVHVCSNITTFMVHNIIMQCTYMYMYVNVRHIWKIANGVTLKLSVHTYMYCTSNNIPLH